MESRALVPVNVSDPLRNGAEGVARGIERAREAAALVARSSAAEPRELTYAAVGMLEARQQVQAAAKVVEAGDRILGTLLDTFA